MKAHFYTLGLLLVSFFSAGQTLPELEEDSSEILNYREVEQYPIHPDCVDATTESERFQCLNTVISNHLKSEFTTTPEIRRQGGGKAFGSFVIETDGSITEVKIEKSAGYEAFDNEVIRVLQLLPKMTPAMVDGKPVRMSFIAPFSIQIM
ncbi:energy transducer TonB [Phaeocystidibacter marisrubri]|uniref:Energy transducer TonB n=1 Tax=Phaeocystidibacter marisrubri TaxID=1577780 RepID=A0A6L3ZE21_9FLAO|nr:energy transducer TonB [Phaeocystidibacter marisrubri]KAB2815838.1 energy transducer TonB [Phaeocystidibacter marisrubri]GGH65977.1 hypothetical protein GCM10011318_03480 [Phaeocystidibacter marisrubri]